LALQDQIAADLRMGRQNSAAFDSKAWVIDASYGAFLLLTANSPEACTLSQSDPTDNALAAIASILDQPETNHEPEAAVSEEKPAVSGPVAADGYSKTGPGPMQSIRFKWTSRRDENGDYYVDETIGENSRPITSGPMSKEAAIQFVDDREGESRRRFEQLKGEMTGQAQATANLARKISSEM
jgi:hypothetical protein